MGVKRFLHRALLLAVVILPLVGTAYAVYRLWNQLVTWQDLALLGGMYLFTGLGIAIGYHRMLTHRGFDSPAPVRAFWLIMGSMALEGPAVEWAATHLKHHAKADREGDPHSPVEGFFTAHVGWIFRDRFVTSGVWAKPFEGDRVAHFVNRTFGVWAILGFLIPAAIGYGYGGWHGFWTGALWGGLVRVFILHHVTWSVNSVCHTFGSRPYQTNDESRNQWVVGVLGFGEGWHNNHHAAPQSAFHGHRWWQIDLAGYLIRLMRRTGIVKNVVGPPAREKRDPAPPTPTPPAPTAVSQRT